MPMYEFKFQEGTITEKFVKMGTKEIKCPECHKKAKKIGNVQKLWHGSPKIALWA